MPSSLTKRLRGSLLRLVLKRTVAMGVGVALVSPSAWLLFQDLPWENGDHGRDRA